jgi:coenzyme F420 hydrogenase subunit beta
VKGHVTSEQLDEFVFGRARNSDEALGIYQRILSARATDQRVLEHSQDGGFATALGMYLLYAKKVDGVLVTKRNAEDGSWKPIPSIATTEEEILACAGTKYYIAPVLMNLSAAVVDKEYDRIAIVGLPCQIQSSRYLQKIKFELSPAITYLIGLFCTKNYEYDKIAAAVEQQGLNFGDIDKFAVNKGYFRMYANGSETKLPLKDVDSWATGFCAYCADYSAEFADISIGTQDSEEGWSTVIVRTDRGAELIAELEAEGYITTQEIASVAKNTSNSDKKHQSVQDPFA